MGKKAPMLKSFLITSLALRPVKETPVQLFSREFCKIFKDITTPVATTDYFELYGLVSNSNGRSFVKENYHNFIQI